jgi:hypothetical protein
VTWRGRITREILTGAGYGALADAVVEAVDSTWPAAQSAPAPTPAQHDTAAPPAKAPAETPAKTPPEERELLTLKQLVAYSALSERTIRDYINAPLRALPCYRIGVKVLVRRSEFDAWMLQHRQVGPAGLDRVVDSVIGPSKRRR